ncbi:uncharacterized protein LOC122640882 isoform X2 [Telopea speciosissima]|uniref:uncharacterized protein LOC122640882 isoform X2 n=1 Tax=Telopea speciosissima TaxID=54955 RepID=UPI001CC3BB6A|nr:uncharacterized protein LOC122640882 isoform X2 [Telopea speciosissima]
MSTMDLEHKGITWVGNLFQKFEAMCLEVEDIVCQETTKIVENQAQSVGVTVKKFYAEVVQDFLPPSSEDTEKLKEGIDENPIVEEPLLAKELGAVSPDGKGLSRRSSFRVFPNISHLLPSSEDTIKGSGADLSIEQNENSSAMYGKLKFGVEFTEEDKLSSPKVLEVMAPARNDMSGASLLSGLHDEYNGKICNTEATVPTLASVDAAQCYGLSDAVACVSDVSSASSASLVLPASYVENETGVGLTPSGGSPATELNDNSKTYKTISPRHGDGQKHYDDCAEFDAILSPPNSGKGRSESDHYNTEEMAEGNDADRSDEETIDACHGVRLEESCILVDYDELHLVSQRTGKNRSYKKKLRDAFASRIRSGKKQQYERLALFYGDADTGTNNQRAGSFQISTPTRDLDSKKSPTHDFCDSEWELL